MDKYQTFSARIGAKLIDSTLIFVLMSIFFPLTFSGELSPLTDLVLINLPFLISVFYTISMHTFQGQTIGKNLLKLKVVDLKEKPLIFGQAFIRSMPQFFMTGFFLMYSLQNEESNLQFSHTFFFTAIFLYLIFQIVDIIIGLVNKRNRTFHDFISQTVVIRTDV